MSITDGYTLNHKPALMGQIADSRLRNVVSKTNTTDYVIPYGKGVVASGEDGAKPPSSSSKATDFVGVAAYEKVRVTLEGNDMGALPKYKFSCLNQGVIWVRVLEDVEARDKVFLRVGATGAGDFCKSAGSSATASVELDDVRFVSKAAAGNLAKISLKVGV